MPSLISVLLLSLWRRSPPLLCWVLILRLLWRPWLVREPSVSFVRRGFLLPRSVSSPPIEVGESSRRGDSEEAFGSPEVVFDATLCLQAMGISFEGNEKGFLDVMS
jgi:hypothetical protein